MYLVWITLKQICSYYYFYTSQLVIQQWLSFYELYAVVHHGYKLNSMLLLKTKPPYNYKNNHDDTIYWMGNQLNNEVIKNLILFGVY